MERQQLALLLGGIGVMFVLMFIVMGGPVFEGSCSGEEECADFFETFFARMFFGFFSIALGSVLVLLAAVLLVIDATDRRRQQQD